MTRSCRRPSIPRPYNCRLTSLSLCIWPSGWPLDAPEAIAAHTAALPLAAPFASEATRVVLARAVPGSNSASAYRTFMAWKSRERLACFHHQAAIVGELDRPGERSLRCERLPETPTAIDAAPKDDDKE